MDATSSVYYKGSFAVHERHCFRRLESTTLTSALNIYDRLLFHGCYNVLPRCLQLNEIVDTLWMCFVNGTRGRATNEQAVIYTEGRAVMRFTAVHANKK